MMTMNGRGRWIALAMVLGLAACSDVVGGDTTKRETPPLKLQEPGIHPVLVVASGEGENATVELHLKRVQVTDRVASFQGELKYDVTQVTLTGTTIPAGITGAFNETEPGTLRFAGVSVDGIEAGSVLTLSVRAAAPVTAEAFELRMQEIVAATFADLVPQLRQAGVRPLLTHSALE
jgi:hypothetical protein